MFLSIASLVTLVSILCPSVVADCTPVIGHIMLIDGRYVDKGSGSETNGSYSTTSDKSAAGTFVRGCIEKAMYLNTGVSWLKAH